MQYISSVDQESRTRHELGIVALGGTITRLFANTASLSGYAVEKATNSLLEHILTADIVDTVEPDAIVFPAAPIEKIVDNIAELLPGKDDESSDEVTWAQHRISHSGIPAAGVSPFEYKRDIAAGQGNNTHVYVIDTGIETRHSEFEGRVRFGFSTVPEPWWVSARFWPKLF